MRKGDMRREKAAKEKGEEKRASCKEKRRLRREGFHFSDGKHSRKRFDENQQGQYTFIKKEQKDYGIKRKGGKEGKEKRFIYSNVEGAKSYLCPV
jgi:hypothetical protein